MPVTPELLAVLACPADDHGRLSPIVVDSAEYLLCGSCGRRFPVDGDIPVLLLDDALPPATAPQ